MTRKQTANYITRRLGFPISSMTLEAFASKGGGPHYCKIGRRTFYEDNELRRWVNARRSPILRSTSHEAELKRASS